jgi:hypothetical protein
LRMNAEHQSVVRTPTWLAESPMNWRARPTKPLPALKPLLKLSANEGSS